MENSGFWDSSSTGKERDSETGFSYFGARYYDSDLMTGWLSVDPMAKSSGANPTRIGEIYMVNHNFDGVAISTTNNVEKGISILNNNIENGLAVVVGIDYKAKQQHNLDRSQIKARGVKQNYIGDGMTDHFITIVGSMYNCNTEAASYYFYDPGSRENGSSLSNVININNGHLQGVTAFKPNHKFKLTTIRPNINTP